VAIHEVAARFFRDRLAGSWVPDYLAGRGFDADVQQRWHIGYAPGDGRALRGHLRAVGYSDALIETAGLAHRNRYGHLVDAFRDRAMLPIRSPHGRIVAFIGRAEVATPKYLNSASTLLYRKGDVLFGLWEASPELGSDKVPVITEGPLDAIAVAVADRGRYAPVALCGTAMTTAQVGALTTAMDLRATEVMVAFDADASGLRAAVNAYRLLSPVAGRLTTVRLPPGADPAQVLRDHGPRGLAAVLRHGRRPLADLVIDAELDRWARWLGFAEGRIGALRRTASVISAMPACDVGRQVGRLADRLALDHGTVTDAVTDALTGGKNLD
jgi:DNA primase catalytic core